MTQLTAALSRTYLQGDLDDLPVKATSAIFEGTAIGFVSGYHRQLAATDEFAGFAMLDVASVATDGLANVRVRKRGRIVLTITSVAVTDIGKAVFATDGNAFTLTQGSAAHVGRVVGVYGTNLAVVAFDANRAGLGGQIAELTDSSGGTASDPLAAITGSYVEATIENTVASLAAKINAIIRALG